MNKKRMNEITTHSICENSTANFFAEIRMISGEQGKSDPNELCH